MTALHLRDSPADVLRRPSHPAPDRTRTLRRRSLSPPRCLPVHGGTLDAPRLYHGYVVLPANREATFILPDRSQKSRVFSIFSEPDEGYGNFFRIIVQLAGKTWQAPTGVPAGACARSKKERERGRMCHCVLTLIRIPHPPKKCWIVYK